MRESEESTPAPFQRMDVNRALDLLRDASTLVLDVRDAAAFKAGHIHGARHVTGSNLAEVLRQTARRTPILIYCYHGNASQSYAQSFCDFGFRNVYSLDGGFEAWRAARP